MESSNRYSKERKSFGRYINRYQEIAFRLAEMMIQTDISRLLIYKAAWELDKNSGEAESAVSCAKIFSSETAAAVSGWAVQIFGGKGYLKGTDVERLYRDAKFGEIVGGTSELHRLSIASEILDRYSN
jgi:alkylation response protein AidB-like acyl-CoA dehydrogenase